MIKVLDRRRFSPEGTLRTDVQVEDRAPLTLSKDAVDAMEKARQKTAPAAQNDTAAPAANPNQFISFIASLATNALAAMGAVPPAQARGIPVNFDLAAEYIDIIAMLHTRTKNANSPEENATLTQLLTELRASFRTAQGGLSA